MKRTSLTCGIVLLCIAALSTSPGSANSSVEQTEFFLDLAPDTANSTLLRIPDTGRKLLALRSYIRMGARIEDRWSWTQEEIAEFQGSEKQKALLAEVAAIKEYFSVVQPGYSLYANTKVRSLDVQIERWNKNESVGIASEQILSAWKQTFGSGDAKFTDLDSKKARNWLARFRPAKRARLAAPGLTLHGQANAVDFQIKQGGRIIADTNSKSIAEDWEKPGWDLKLKNTIDAAGPSFTGPLKTPYEPWHYRYDSPVEQE